MLQRDSLRTGIYTGAGASHSWLWFVDMLERYAFYDIAFLRQEDITRGDLSRFDAVIFAGGDTFSIAESVGERGAEELEKYISKGGLYIGSCAGAYFPLEFNFQPLNYFNLINASVANFTMTLPEAITLQEKFSCPYGDGYVFHPVREEVLLRPGALCAPIYGGPAFILHEDAGVLAEYHAFNNKTLFLCSPDIARSVYLDKPAVILKPVSNGKLLLLGPHLEHPSYYEANRFLMDIILQNIMDADRHAEESWFVDSETNPVSTTELRRIVTNLRISALGLGNSLRWKVGRKTYEPEKIQYFIEFIWKRLRGMPEIISCETGAIRLLAEGFNRLSGLLRSLKDEKDNRVFEVLLDGLKFSVCDFLGIYLRFKKQEKEKLYA